MCSNISLIFIRQKLSEHLKSANPIYFLCRSLVMITTSKTKNNIWGGLMNNIFEDSRISHIAFCVFLFSHITQGSASWYVLPNLSSTFYLQSLNIMLCWVHLNKGLLSSFSLFNDTTAGSQQKTESLTSVDIPAYIYWQWIYYNIF